MYQGIRIYSIAYDNQNKFSLIEKLFNYKLFI
jgi:hypothetical protein